MVFELKGEFAISGSHDAPVNQDVYEVRHDVVQQTLIVGDENEGALRIAEGIDAVGDDLEGIDVEARVGLVKDRQPRFEDREVEYLVALFLAARKARVDRPF